ncbi:bifunctional helix-turn-helix domain-containing protein/methylated-DNA--[protein]-cysteine S-methyltransferase [Larkinella terrae]|uniref:methylated-DNA--[protein]-cysteine S-methyltransferase n=1 Tax=Larkinella terrae TaxID=2025311 RepID=A0A7K0ETD8_9BACT|nr:methylated-DNA--[protein]-cysteine S-methyltransferase [Larkinella terrae]MRS65083.1 methylated-DNA--[protein]-cysteine S-methyltransferase [Larkinella terrae]
MYETEANPTYQQIARSIEFLTDNFQQQPSLADVADQANLSEYHFQRLFSDWAGVSPKKFLQYLTLDFAKERLRNGLTLAEAADEAGLSGTGRLHDLFVVLEGVTPGQFKQAGEGLTIRYAVFESPFGPYLLGTIGDKIVKLEFLDEAEPTDQISIANRFAAEWPEAVLVPDAQALRPLADSIFTDADRQPLRVLVKASPFQLKVWEALLRIPEGQVVSYDQIAAAIGMPLASRAVGTAIGSNPVGYLIPCHRVIRKTGLFGNYRWGATRKTALLGWEAAHSLK